jgi:hypothetical protein
MLRRLFVCALVRAAKPSLVASRLLAARFVLPANQFEKSSLTRGPFAPFASLARARVRDADKDTSKNL